MTYSSERLEKLVKECIELDGEIEEKLEDPSIDFGFLVYFPKGSKQPPFTITKLKNKPILAIRCMVILPEKINEIDPLIKLNYFTELKLAYLLKGNHFMIDENKNQIDLRERIYLDRNYEFSIESFNEHFWRIRFCFAYISILGEKFNLHSLLQEEIEEDKSFDDHYA
ncbi:MAG: hypothetical protein ACFE8A_13290 [Candidatus Hodarchaeota archaeon]